MTLSIRLADTLSSSEIYGPGKRFVIWVQGCSLGCSGCWNKDFWSDEGGVFVDVEKLLSEILVTEDIEGITILGGEPLEQPEAIKKLIKNVKKNDLTVMLYTGFEESELNDIQLECVNLSDIAIMGRYVSALRDINLRWRGSSNQKIKIISETYRNINIIEQEEVEITISKEGEITMSGYPRKWLLRVLNEM